uniref:MARVEL domain-containing protein n=1 Tax=Steinernema glaseri TaxID=37863 RepID=A0A1I7ZHC1_9BILA
MDAQKICGCRPITAGATGFALQAIALLLALSGSGLILDSYRQWRSSSERALIPSTTEPPLTTFPVCSIPQTGGDGGDSEAGIWAEGWLELGLAWYVSFCTLWLFTVILASLSFRYYRSIIVVPNIVVLCFGFVAHLFAFAFLIARLVTPSPEYQVTQYEETIICIMCGYSLFAFLFNFCAAFLTHKYMGYLEYRRLDFRPKTNHTTQNSTWNSNNLY